jgi:hypothetical protein
MRPVYRLSLVLWGFFTLGLGDGDSECCEYFASVEFASVESEVTTRYLTCGQKVRCGSEEEGAFHAANTIDGGSLADMSTTVMFHLSSPYALCA